VEIGGTKIISCKDSQMKVYSQPECQLTLTVSTVGVFYLVYFEKVGEFSNDFCKTVLYDPVFFICSQ